MAILEAIFNDHIWKPVWLAEVNDGDNITQASDTDNQTQNIGDLALTPPTNPFRALMDKIEKLMDTGNPEDLRHAFYMVGDALHENQFGSDREQFILADRWAALGDLLKQQNPDAPYNFSSPAGIRPVQQFMM